VTYPLSHLYQHFGLVRLSWLGRDVSWTKAGGLVGEYASNHASKGAAGVALYLRRARLMDEGRAHRFGQTRRGHKGTQIRRGHDCRNP
jgi:hypothetical protein